MRLAMDRVSYWGTNVFFSSYQASKSCVDFLLERESQDSDELMKDGLPKEQFYLWAKPAGEELETANDTSQC